MTKQTIGSIIEAGLAADKTTDAILADVRAAFPDAKTQSASVNWYRSKMRRTTAEPAKTPAAAAVASTVPVYTVGSIKLTTGCEGHVYSAKLYRDGKYVAIVSDWAMGGELIWSWNDSQLPRVPMHLRNYMGEVHETNGTPEEALLAAYTLSLPAVATVYQGVDIIMTLDYFVEELVNDTLMLKDLKKLTKKIAYITGDGKIFTVTAEPTEDNIKKYVTAHNATVLNGMPEREAIALLRKYQ